MEARTNNPRFATIPNLHPPLGSIDGVIENEDVNDNDRDSLIIRNNECVICMDNQRGKSCCLV